jgi:hypothetical protein
MVFRFILFYVILRCLSVSWRILYELILGLLDLNFEIIFNPPPELAILNEKLLFMINNLILSKIDEPSSQIGQLTLLIVRFEVKIE